VDRAREQIGKQAAITWTQRFAEPEAGGQGLRDIEARGLSEIKDERKAQCDDHARMGDQEVPELGGGAEALANA